MSPIRARFAHALFGLSLSALVATLSTSALAQDRSMAGT